MAKPILAANWKNYPNSLSEAQKLLKDLSKKRALFKKTSLFIIPPYPYLESAALRIKGFGALGIQDLSLEEGTHTGEVTPQIVKSFGAKLAIVGHSERRAMGESVELIARKIKLALHSGLSPLICIGEKERDHDGVHFEKMREELKKLLSGLDKNEAGKIAVAYEPIWAIGRSASEAIEPADLSQTAIFIKKVLNDLFGEAVAKKIPILYGGSVEPANAEALMKSGVRGFLVGHASLNAKSFEEIARSITK